MHPIKFISLNPCELNSWEFVMQLKYINVKFRHKYVYECNKVLLYYKNLFLCWTFVGKPTQ